MKTTRQKRVSLATRRRRCWPAIEALEDRLVLTTFTVTSLSDAVRPPTGVLTFRQAISLANADAGRNAMHRDTIAFSVSGEIDLTSNLPALSSDTAVHGPGASSLTIAAQSVVQDELEVAASAQSVSISGVTLSGSSSSLGLLVDANASATLTSATITGNAIGGIEIENGAAVTATSCSVTGSTTGVGISVGTSTGSASLTLIQSTVAGNSRGGINVESAITGPSNSLSISQSTITGNDNNNASGSSLGGGISLGANSLASVVDTTIADNHTISDGGGVYVGPGVSLTVDGSTIADNQAGSSGSGGGMYVGDASDHQC